MWLSWDVLRPPTDPPQECVDTDGWARSYRVFAAHHADELGMCRLCCVTWPCDEHNLGLRGLLDACVPRNGAVPSRTGQDRVLHVSICRWCELRIELHSRWGWMHGDHGLFLCRHPRDGAPPLSVAEPVG